MFYKIENEKLVFPPENLIMENLQIFNYWNDEKLLVKDGWIKATTDEELLINEGFAIVVNSKISDIRKTPEYIAEQEQMRKEQFGKDFFQTSLGYVRRKVFIRGTGETADFLKDCLPVLQGRFNRGGTIMAIVYNQPSFAEDVSNWIQYQKTDINWLDKAVQEQFLNDCEIQYQKDFFDD